MCRHWKNPGHCTRLICSMSSAPRLSGRNLTGTAFVGNETLVLLHTLSQHYIFYLSSVNRSRFSTLTDFLHAKDMAILPTQPCLLNLVWFTKGVKGKSSFIWNCARVSHSSTTDCSSSKEEVTPGFSELGRSRGMFAYPNAPLPLV